MSNEHASETHDLASSTKRFMSVLSEASIELNKRFTACAEILTELNEKLEQQIDIRLAEINKKTDRTANDEFAQLNKERDSLFTSFSLHKQEELRSLYLLEEQLNQLLQEKMEESLSELSKASNERLSQLQELVYRSESNCKRELSSARRAFSERLPEQKQLLLEEIYKESKLHDDLVSNDLSRLEENYESACANLMEYCLELKENLDQQGSHYLDLLSRNNCDTITCISDASRKHIEHIENIAMDCTEITSTIMHNQLNAACESFQETSNKIAQQRKQAHQALLNQFSHKYKTKLISIDREITANIDLAAAEWNATLRAQRDYYQERACLLLKKFERTLRESQNAKSSVDEHQEIRTYLPAKITKLKQKVRELTEADISEFQIALDRKLEIMRRQIEGSKTNTITVFDSLLSALRQEILECAGNNTIDLKDIERELHELDSSLEETRALVTIIEKASLAV